LLKIQVGPRGVQFLTLQERKLAKEHF